MICTQASNSLRNSSGFARTTDRFLWRVGDAEERVSESMRNWATVSARVCACSSKDSAAAAASSTSAAFWLKHKSNQTGRSRKSGHGSSTCSVHKRQWVRTIGLQRTKVKIGLMNLVYNMVRLLQLIIRDANEVKRKLEGHHGKVRP